MTEQYDGLYCLNAQGKEQRLVLKGLPAYGRKAERKSFRAVRPVGQQNPCAAGRIRRKNQCAT